MWVVFFKQSTASSRAADKHWHYSSEENARTAFVELCTLWKDDTDCSEGEFEEQIRDKYFTLCDGGYVQLYTSDSE
jgi:hypothetical protein